MSAIIFFGIDQPRLYQRLCVIPESGFKDIKKERRAGKGEKTGPPQMQYLTAAQTYAC